MKNILSILCLFISFLSYGQVITTNTPGAVPRSNKATKAVEDFNLAARTNFFVPRMDDTTQANTNATMDTCGRLVYTYDVDGYWYRRCTPSRHWERVGGSASVILPQCGIANGTGIVTWDSLLVFDVTASLYALCCDNVARVTPDTVIVLPPSDPDNPRIDAIVLTRNGIEIDTGIAQANPALPQLDSCELLLTYVLINAGETVPAFVTPNNPLSIYDENYTTEWIIDSIHNITMDTADVTFPVHLTKDIKITSYTVTDNFFEFHTDSTINLNDYGALKLYIRSPSSNGPIRVFFTWYLDGQQQTISQFTQSLPAMASPVYNIIVVPISNFSTLSGASTSVNNLRINISGGSTTFYIDWIQLQSGIPAPASPTGIQSFSSGNLSPLFNTQVAINGSQIVQSFIQQPAGSYTVLSNRTNVSGSYSFGKIDLSTPIVTGLLPIINVAPSANDGDFVQTIGGLTTWTTLTNDTTFVGNGLVRRADPNSNNDTLYFGYSKADTASFAFDTYLNQNNFFLAMQKGRFEEYKGTNTAAANNLTLPSDGNTITITGNTQINAITTARWQAGSQVELIFTGTPTVKNNTAGGAGTATILLAGSTDFVAAANDVLSLVYDGANWHETARKTASGQNWESTLNLQLTPFNAVHVVDLGDHPFELVNGNHINFTVATGTSTEADVNIYSGFVGLGNFSGGNLTNIQIDDVAQTIIFGSYGSGTHTGTPTYNLSVDASGNIIETTGETLQQVFNTEAGGSVLTKLDTIQSGAFGILDIGTGLYSFKVLNNNAGTGVFSSVTGTGVGIYGETQGAGVGVSGVALGAGNAVQGIGVAGSIGIYGQTPETGIPVEARLANSSNNSVGNGLRIMGVTSGANNGFGVSLDYYLSTSTATALSNQIISKWTDATNATRTSQFIITGVNSAVTGNVLVIAGDGSTQMPKYGAGAATFDASGNITSVSDVRLKDIQGDYNGGLNELMNVTPIIYKWNEKSGMEREHNYIGFSAQNIQSALGNDAIGINQEGYLSIQDRAILATLTNAVKEQQKEIEYLKHKVSLLENK